MREEEEKEELRKPNSLLCNHEDLFLPRAGRAAAPHRAWVGEEPGARAGGGEAGGVGGGPSPLPWEPLTNGHCTESYSPEAVRILWGQPWEPQRGPPARLQKNTLALGPEINLQLL